MLHKYNFLQIGLGSMGKRRIRNLLFHGIKPKCIYGFDVSKKRCREIELGHGIQTSSNFHEAYGVSKPDVLIISTPPDQHSEYFLKAARERKNFFVEVTTTDKGYSRLFPLLNNSFVAAPSCTFRHYSPVKKIKTIIASGIIGNVLTFTHHLGQYLPDWHPWEDYRKVYFAQYATGACREMFAYELIWLNYILGSRVSSVQGITQKVSDLKMTADDLYSALISYKNNIVGTMVIDLLSRTAQRTVRFIGTEGVLEWDWQNRTIKLFSTKYKKWKTIHLGREKKQKHYVTTEDMYEEEMGEFLKAIKNKTQPPYTFREDWEILKTLFALEKSSKNNKRIFLE